MNVIEVPGVCDHELEVLVIIDCAADVGVVFDELAEGDLAVAVLRVLKTVVHLESIEELGQHLLLALNPLLNVGVHLRIVVFLNVVFVKLTASIHVDLPKGLLDEALANRRHFSGNGAHELVIRDFAAVVGVKQVEQLATLLGGDRHAEVANRLPKLLNIKRATAVVVHDLEDPLHAKEAASAPRRELISESLNELVIGLLDAAVVDT